MILNNSIYLILSFSFFVLIVIIAINRLNCEVKKCIYFYEFNQNLNNLKGYISKEGKFIYLLTFYDKFISVSDTKIPIFSSTIVNMIESGHADSNADLFNILVKEDIKNYIINVNYDY